MALKCGIVGLPNVGKSTLFNCLSSAKAQAANFPFCTIEPNVGVITVPDERLTKLAEIVHPGRIVPATCEIVDIAGLVKGASKGEGLGNKFLGNIRETDAIIHVLRCFEDENITHVDGTIDPIRDKEIIDTELQLKDLETIESRLAKTEKAEMQELMELDRMEMENEYRGFTLQYDELRNTIQNDTLAQQLNAERQRAQQLLEELQRVKANDANYVAEIKRLRKELADVRAVMRHYIAQIDSLQQINKALVAENTEVKAKYNQATTQISNLNTEREQLKVQLDYMQFKPGQKLEGTPVDWCFLGACTNGRIEDFRAFASVVQGRRKAPGVTAWLVPGSWAVRRQIIEEGIDKILEEAGFELRLPSCSACLAMNPDKVPAGKLCISTSNRNFVGRQGPGSRTVLASPLTVAASAITGVITDPRKLL